MIHHRTPEFDRILARVLKGLKDVFKTNEDVYVISSTGSGGMEALLVNVLNPLDEVLCIDSGKFGERWNEMAKVFGAKTHTVKLEWGKAVTAAQVKEQLDKNPKIKIVLTQACETSSGVLHPIKEIGELIHKYPDTLFLVDGITALGALPLPMDEWHIDGLVGGSQKAFMLPTGLAMFSFSQKAWKKIENNPTPRFYFDVRKEKAANKKGETFFSSNVSLIRALDVVLELIDKKGLDSHYREINKRAEFTRHFGQKLGLKLYAEKPSASLTALTVPPGIDSQILREKLEKNHHITIMGGQDQAKGKIIRIGHMGHILPEQMNDLIQKLGLTLNEMGAEISPVSENEMKNWWQTNA